MLLLLKSNRAVYDILILLLSYPEKRGNLTSERVYVDENDEESEEEKDKDLKKGEKNCEDDQDNHTPIEGDDCYIVFGVSFS